MPKTLQFQKTDTLAATLNSGATSTTLTSGNFGTPSGAQWLVIDYDVPAKAEIILATISGTALTSITRGLSGGAASTTDHAIGAKVGFFFVPQHYSGLQDGTDWSSSAIQKGYTTLASDQTLTGSLADVTGLTTTFTVPADRTSVRLTFSGKMQQNTDANSSIQIAFFEGVTNVYATYVHCSQAGISLNACVVYNRQSTAGSKTFKVQASYTGGAAAPALKSGSQFIVDLI